MTCFWRLTILTGLLALAACGGDQNGRRIPVPSAARGGVQPHPFSSAVAEAGAPQSLEAPIASPPAVAKAAANAAASFAAPVPVVDKAAETVAAPVAAAGNESAAPVVPLPAPKQVRAKVAALSVPAKTESPVAEASTSVVPSPAFATVPNVDKAVVAAKAPVSETATARATSAANTGIGREYVLGTGDEIRLTVYGEDDLSGQYQIGSTGIVALPLVGNVEAAGHTISQFEGLVRDKMTQGYLKDPRVSVQVANYRPFFILGEVAKPGSYPYVNGMTVLSAVALAGGYTYRADKGDIRVTHANVPTKEEQDADERTNVVPGDIIRVTERFF